MAGALSPGFGAPDVVIAAAMEPSRNGGSTGQHAAARFIHSMPQWSPPLNGGSTGYISYHHADWISPQWSPPPDGGSTWPWVSTAPRSSGRNGARR